MLTTEEKAYDRGTCFSLCEASLLWLIYYNGTSFYEEEKRTLDFAPTPSLFAAVCATVCMHALGNL